MNNVVSFLGLTAAIFTAVTALLAFLSHLEANLRDQDAEKDRPPS
jgi:hypothetical protein